MQQLYNFVLLFNFIVQSERGEKFEEKKLRELLGKDWLERVEIEFLVNTQTVFLSANTFKPDQTE